MSNFRPVDRDTGFLLPPSVDEWLPERHLAQFVVEVTAGLDLRMLTGSCRGSGGASYHLELLLGLIIYGYATGVLSSRKLERATYDSVAFRFIAANQDPDHYTIAAFRRRFLPQIEALGDCAREATIEARAKERHAREQAEHDARMAQRAAKTVASGKKPSGRIPQPPVLGPLPTDLVNLTDEASRIMPVAGGGFVQCYNAQAAVAVGSLLVIATEVTQAPNDKQQFEPMLGKIADLPSALGKVGELLADAGYFSEGNVNACAAAGIDPLIAIGREIHYPSLDERFAEAPLPPQNLTPLATMNHRLKTPDGKKLYALRKHTPEPVFGIIKSAVGFCQFLLRGLDNVRDEWNLVTMAWNIKRMFVLAGAI